MQKDWVAVTVRKQPEVFCLSLGMRIRRSARLLSKDTRASLVVERAQDILSLLAQTQQEVGRTRLPEAATLFGFGTGERRIARLALGEDGFVLTAQCVQLPSCQGMLGQFCVLFISGPYCTAARTLSAKMLRWC